MRTREGDDAGAGLITIGEQPRKRVHPRAAVPYPFYDKALPRMFGQVKGTLFVDYVRMLRAQKGVDWSRHLTADDLVFLSQRIEPADWYPMETFERMGLAILNEITPNLDLVRAWGRAQIDWLSQTHANLIAVGDARETLMRFRVLRASFFDYDALQIADLCDGEAVIIAPTGWGPEPKKPQATKHSASSSGCSRSPAQPGRERGSRRKLGRTSSSRPSSSAGKARRWVDAPRGHGLEGPGATLVSHRERGRGVAGSRGCPVD